MGPIEGWVGSNGLPIRSAQGSQEIVPAAPHSVNAVPVPLRPGLKRAAPVPIRLLEAEVMDAEGTVPPTLVVTVTLLKPRNGSCGPVMMPVIFVGLQDKMLALGQVIVGLPVIATAAGDAHVVPKFAAVESSSKPADAPQSNRVVVVPEFRV